MESRRSVLGPDHPQTICSISALAACLESAGEYADACSLYRELLEMSDNPECSEYIETQVVSDGLDRCIRAVEQQL